MYFKSKKKKKKKRKGWRNLFFDLPEKLLYKFWNTILAI